MKATATKIVQTLQDAGHEAFVVGGAVRDFLLGLEPKDYDIASSATPSEIEDLFNHTDAVGKHFGVIIVHLDGFSFEIATYREDSNSSDGRRPDSVTFSTLDKDSERRDFTINAMYWNPINDTIIDLHGGRKDLENGIIRFVGDPYKRIKEDYLRILRALRFASRYDFKIEEDSFNCIKMLSTSLWRVSSERVYNEIKQILSKESGQKLFKEANLHARIFGDYSNYETRDKSGLSFEGFVAFLLSSQPNNWEKALKALSFEAKAVKGILRRIQACEAIYVESVSGDESDVLAMCFHYYDVMDDVAIMSGFKKPLPPLPEQLVFAADLMPLGINGKALGDKLKELREVQFLNPEITKGELLKS